MHQYVIYDHPTDYPDNFVVRRWIVKPGQFFADPEPMALTYTLEAARIAIEAMAPGLARIEPHPDDDPKIAEVWL